MRQFLCLAQACAAGQQTPDRAQFDRGQMRLIANNALRIWLVDQTPRSLALEMIRNGCGARGRRNMR